MADLPPGASRVSPVKKLFSLLHEDNRDIAFVYLYSIIIGIVNLSLPLGIQGVVTRVSGGMIFDSVYILIGMVIGGITLAGIIQVMQIYLVEVLQRRVFARTAFAFTYRLMHMRFDAVRHAHPPELMNRFFDVMNLQKGMPKLLVDLMAAAIQVLFGLLLLAFYHPFFIALSAMLVLFLYLLFRMTGPEGLRTSIKESTQKYRMAYWLQELARTIRPVRLDESSEANRRTSGVVDDYLYYRAAHFQILIRQYIWILIFKVTIIGGMLVLGTYLVVNRSITLGQFVAAEVIIIVLVGAVEKLIQNMDVVYDMLTGAEKVSHVSMLPLEPREGRARLSAKGGIALKLDDLELHIEMTPGAPATVRRLSAELGPGGLHWIEVTDQEPILNIIDVISGSAMPHAGRVTVDGIPVRELDYDHWRAQINLYTGATDLVEGTIESNMHLVRPTATYQELLEQAQQLGIGQDLINLPEGLKTAVQPGGRNLPGRLAEVLPLAFRLLGGPRLLLIQDGIRFLKPIDKADMIEKLANRCRDITIVVFSPDGLWQEAARRTAPATTA